MGAFSGNIINTITVLKLKRFLKAYSLQILICVATADIQKLISNKPLARHTVCFVPFPYYHSFIIPSYIVLFYTFCQYVN